MQHNNLTGELGLSPKHPLLSYTNYATQDISRTAAFEKQMFN